MRLSIFETMNRGEGDQRLWFVVDELDALGQIDGLKDALARLRKFGGRCVLGFQSIAQVSGTYGRAEAQTIVENCGNTLILRCSAGERGGTSGFASQLIGQREVLRTTQSRSRQPLRWLSTITRSESLSVESAVMDSEIEQLPDLKGYLKFASSPRWRRVALALPGASLDGNAAASTRGAAREAWEAFRSGEHRADHVGGVRERSRGPDSFDR
jgi:type IV secretory pathway TraG/TraD family ATPase VirD4